MRWAKTSLRNSFFGWLAHEPVAESDDDLEALRAAMLRVLDQSAGGVNSAIERKLLFARDIDQLWYARPDLMTAIAASKGEAVANTCLAEVTRLFETRVPDRFKSRGRPAKRRG